MAGNDLICFPCGSETFHAVDKDGNIHLSCAECERTVVTTRSELEAFEEE